MPDYTAVGYHVGMNHFKPLLVLSLLLACSCSHQQPAATNDPFHFDMKQYERQRVLTAADKYLSEKPDTITSHPCSRSPGGLHDFYSEGDYYWPATLPSDAFVGRDGNSYPGMFMDHRWAMWRFDIQVPALVSAYLITGDKKYSNHAIEHLRAWFINPDTMMNPSLDHAQAVQHKTTGSVFGVIDTLHLVEVAQSIVVLRKHRAISPQDDAAVTKWFAEYIHWLRTAPNGVKEGEATNNHSDAYWLQVAAFSRVTNDDAMLAECRRRFKTQLLPQTNPDGSFQRELNRTKPYGYSLFVLDQIVMLAQVASSPDDNLFDFSLPDGRSLRKSLTFMYPYVINKSTWPKPPDVMIYDKWPVRSPAWLYGGRAYHEAKYIELWKSLDANPTNEEVLRNLPIRQPVIWEE